MRSFKFCYLFAILSLAFKDVCRALGNDLGVVGVTPPAILPAQSQKIGFDSELRLKSVLEDIYTDCKGLYNTEKKTMSNGIYMEISDAALSQSNRAVITMRMRFRNPGVMGNAVAIGNEELPTTKAATIFRNNCRKVTANPMYGVRKLDQDYLDLRKSNVDELSVWNKEEEGLEIRQALLETFGETLVSGDTAASCVRNWNKNIFVAGLPLNGPHPVYSTNPALYTSSIVTAMLASGGGHLAPIVNQTPNQPNLSALSNFALARRIQPLKIPGAPGGQGYVLTISEIQAMYLGDPAWSSRNLGELFLKRDKLHTDVQNWRGVIGMYKDLLIVQDPRLPTLLPSGSSAPFGLTAGYMWHGDTDLRARGNKEARDVAFLHGQGAVWKWYPEKIHFIEQLDDYGIIKGIGTACVRGVGSLVYDQQTPGIGTQEQFSSVAVLFTMPDYV